MKRDYDLIRRIMAHIESLQPNHFADENSFIVYLKLGEEYDRAVILEHIEMIYERTLIKGAIHKTHDGKIDSVTVTGLTWEGYDFLDATRDVSIWNKAKKTILRPTASITYSILLEWLKQEIKEKIGLP